VVISVLLAAADPSSQNVSIFDPVSPPAESVRSLSVLVLAITAFIFVVVEGILVYTIVRFRRGRQVTNLTQAAEPPQVYGSKPIEIAWTAAPALIVFVLVLVTARTLWEVNVFVTVVGRQWWWEFVYDHYNGRELGFTTANELHVPAGGDGVSRPVYLTLKSADVCHSFWVPRLAGKTDLIPGRINSMWFQVDMPGLYLGQCAEYCGTQHANMLLRVSVDSPKAFESWLENQRQPAAPVGAGQSTFLAQSCINCHRVRGTSAQGTYAPDLTHLMSRQTLASGVLPNTPDNLRRWLADPQPIKPGCLMPAFGLSDRERDEIVRYLLTLR
jgi:cytochrome c oxidase subunit 2